MIIKYINQEAAINIIMASIVHQNSHDVNLHNIGLRKAMGAINSLPAADVVEVRHGRWKLYENGDGTCSECGTYQKHIWDLDHWQNFCGHCGADMRDGGQDE